jgi:hypothetical protein
VLFNIILRATSALWCVQTAPASLSGDFLVQVPVLCLEPEFTTCAAAPPCRCMTEGLSIPLTAALACSHLYSSSQLQLLQEFTLHLVGSSQYEFQQVAKTTVVEELMHWLPAVKKLNVVMIGTQPLARRLVDKQFGISCKAAVNGTAMCPMQPHVDCMLSASGTALATALHIV